MVEPPARTLLVPFIGIPPLLTPGLIAAHDAAITMSAITVLADEKHCVALLAATNSMEGVPLRHGPTPYVVAGGIGQRGSFRDRLEQALFGLPDEGRRTRNPAASNGGVLYFPPYATILRRQSGSRMIG